jgi:hypothetical protein
MSLRCPWIQTAASLRGPKRPSELSCSLRNRWVPGLSSNKRVRINQIAADVTCHHILRYNRSVFILEARRQRHRS